MSYSNQELVGDWTGSAFRARCANLVRHRDELGQKLSDIDTARIEFARKVFGPNLDGIKN